MAGRSGRRGQRGRGSEIVTSGEPRGSGGEAAPADMRATRRGTAKNKRKGSAGEAKGLGKAPSRADAVQDSEPEGREVRNDERGTPDHVSTSDHVEARSGSLSPVATRATSGADDQVESLEEGEIRLPSGGLLAVGDGAAEAMADLPPEPSTAGPSTRPGPSPPEPTSGADLPKESDVEEGDAGDDFKPKAKRAKGPDEPSSKRRKKDQGKEDQPPEPSPEVEPQREAGGADAAVAVGDDGDDDTYDEDDFIPKPKRPKPKRRKKIKKIAYPKKGGSRRNKDSVPRGQGPESTPDAETLLASSSGEENTVVVDAEADDETEPEPRQGRTGRKPKKAENQGRGLLVGTRLEVLFDNPPQYYPGVVEKYDAKHKTAFVKYDDGDDETFDMETVDASTFRIIEVPDIIGMRIKVLFDNPRRMFPGTIEDKGEGEGVYHIKYDDGTSDDEDLLDLNTMYRWLEPEESGPEKKKKQKKRGRPPKPLEEPDVQRSPVKRKKKQETPKKMKRRESVMLAKGTRIEIKYDNPPQYFQGVVIGQNKEEGTCLVRYVEDGVEESVNFGELEIGVGYCVLPKGSHKFSPLSKVTKAKKGQKPGQVSNADSTQNRAISCNLFDSIEAKVVKPQAVVWAKLKGFPHWPGEIREDLGWMAGVQNPVSNGSKVCVCFFGNTGSAKDYKREISWVDKDKLFPFEAHFAEFAPDAKGVIKGNAKAKKKVKVQKSGKLSEAIRDACTALRMVYAQGKLRKMKAAEISALNKKLRASAGLPSGNRLTAEEKAAAAAAKAEAEAAKAKAREEELQQALQKRIAAGLRVPKPKVIKDIGYDEEEERKKKERKALLDAKPTAKDFKKLKVVPLEDFNITDIVWAKSPGCPFWPAQILDLNQLPDGVKSHRKLRALPVIYLGPPSKDKQGADYGWIKKGDIFPFREHLDLFRDQRITKAHKLSSYTQAIDTALGLESGTCENPLVVGTTDGSVVAEDGAGAKCKSCGCLLKDGVAHQAGGCGGLCRLCKRSYENGDFCKVCEEMYLPTDKDMVCCDSCNMWIHGKCDPEAANVIIQSSLSKEELPYSCPMCREVISKQRKVHKSSKAVAFLSEGGKNQMEARRLFAMEFLVEARKKKNSERSVSEEEKALRVAWTSLGADGQKKYLEKAAKAHSKTKKTAENAKTKNANPDKPAQPRKIPEGPWSIVKKDTFQPIDARWAKDHCSVCNLDYDFDNNQFVTCTACGITVHQHCYGVLERPAVDDVWLCRACEKLEKDEKKFQCCVCPIGGGALKPTTIPGQWCHVACSHWVPELSLLDYERCEPIEGVERIHKDRWTHKCTICKKEMGAIIQCHSCYVAFHPLCARMMGYEMQVAEVEDRYEYRAYCARHSRELKPGKGLLPASSEVELKGEKILDPSQYVLNVDLPPLTLECPSGCSRCEPLHKSLGWAREDKGSGRGFSSTKGFWIPLPPKALVVEEKKKSKDKTYTIKVPKSKKQPLSMFDKSNWQKEPVAPIPLPEGCPEQVTVCCTTLFGVLLVRPQMIIYQGEEISPSTMEKLGGKAATKKWKNSLWACTDQGVPLMMMQEWLDQHGLDKAYLLKLQNNAKRIQQYEEWKTFQESQDVGKLVNQMINQVVLELKGSNGLYAEMQLAQDAAENEPALPTPSRAEPVAEASTRMTCEDPSPAGDPSDDQAVQEVVQKILDDVVNQNENHLQGETPSEDEDSGVLTGVTITTNQQSKPATELSLDPKKQLAQAVVGQRLKIFWSEETKWYPARILTYNKEHDIHRIQYEESGEREWLPLDQEQVMWDTNHRESAQKSFAHCVGQRVGVWWEDDKQFYYGQAREHNPLNGQVLIAYDDNQQEWLDLSKEKIDWSQSSSSGGQPGLGAHGPKSLIVVDCNGLKAQLITSSHQVNVLGVLSSPEMFVEFAGLAGKGEEWKSKIMVVQDVKVTEQTVGAWLKENGLEITRFNRFGKRRRTLTHVLEARPSQSAKRRDVRRPRTGKQAFVRGLAYRVKFPRQEKDLPEFKAWTGQEWIAEHNLQDLIPARPQEAQGKEEEAGAAAEVDEATRFAVGAVMDAVVKAVELTVAEAVPGPDQDQDQEEPKEPEDPIAWALEKAVLEAENQSKMGLFPNRGVVGLDLEIGALAPHRVVDLAKKCTCLGYDLDKAVLLVDNVKGGSVDFGDEVIGWHTLLGSWKENGPPLDTLFEEVEEGSFAPLVLGVHCVGWRVSVLWPDNNLYYLGVVDDFNFLNGKHRVIYDDGNYEWLDLSKEGIKWLAPEGKYKKPSPDVPQQITIVSNGKRAIFHVHTRQVEVEVPVTPPPEEPLAAPGGPENEGEAAAPPGPEPETPGPPPDPEVVAFLQEMVGLVEFYANGIPPPSHWPKHKAPRKKEMASLLAPILPAKPAPPEEAGPQVRTELITLDEFESRARVESKAKKLLKARVVEGEGKAAHTRNTVMQWLLKEGLTLNLHTKLSLVPAKKKDKAAKKARKAKEKPEEEEEPEQVTFDVVPLLKQIEQCSVEERFKVTFGKSVIHGWGLFAKVPIKEGEAVAEYRGDIVRYSVANQREDRYQKQKKDLYLFGANTAQVIDSTDVGSIARFMNHSCAPSCYIKSVDDNKTKIPHLAFFARCDIVPGQELTFDYRLKEEDGENKIECKCGAPTCKGTLN